MEEDAVGVEQDIAAVAEQEKVLRFPEFSADLAWQMGSHLRAAAIERGAAMTFEIRVADRVLFHTATFEAAAGQQDWIRRKRNSVMRFARSTYGLGLELERLGLSMEAKHGLSLSEFAMHGGGFPIFLTGLGCIGSVVSSGLPQRNDHNLVVDALAAVLKVKTPRLEARA